MYILELIVSKDNGEISTCNGKFVKPLLKMHYLQTEFVYEWRGLFKSIFDELKNPKWYGSFKEVGVYYDVVVNSDNVVYYGFPEQSMIGQMKISYNFERLAI